MPDFIRFLLRHAAIGFLIACGFVGMVLWTNMANIRHLVTHTEEGPLALAVFLIFCTITFGSVQMGIRVMMLADSDDDEPKGPAEPIRSELLIPVETHDQRPT